MPSQLPLPPGQTGWPIVGETISFLTNPDFIVERYQQYGPVFRSQILGRPTVFMVGPDAAEFLLSSHAEHFSWREGWPDNFKALLGESLFVQEGEEHRRNRRLMMPALHGAALPRYVGTMSQITQQYLQKWEHLQEFQWFEEFKQLTFAIASQLLLGTNPGDDVQRLSQLFTTLTNGLFSLSRLPGSNYQRGLTARQQIVEHVTRVVRDRQHHPTSDVLSLLIQAEDEQGDRMSLEELVNQAILLLFAGHETTTAMLTWLFLELGRHPTVLQQAQQEQWTLAQQGDLSIEQISKMVYLDQILCEIERLHPPVGGGFRGVIKPFEFNGYQVPAGWLAQYSILYTHRLESLYPNPDTFNPDRFASGQQDQRSFSLLGFGGGPRICLGIAFAKLELKIIAALILRRYQWQMLPNQRLDAVTIPTRRPKDGLRVTFQQLSNGTAPETLR
jgi:retinoid hydroxylase